MLESHFTLWSKPEQKWKIIILNQIILGEESFWDVQEKNESKWWERERALLWLAAKKVSQNCWDFSELEEGDNLAAGLFLSLFRLSVLSLFSFSLPCLGLSLFSWFIILSLSFYHAPSLFLSYTHTDTLYRFPPTHIKVKKTLS